MHLPQIVFACFFYAAFACFFLFFTVNKLKKLNIIALISFYRKNILIFAEEYAAFSEYLE